MITQTTMYAKLQLEATSLDMQYMFHWLLTLTANQLIAAHCILALCHGENNLLKFKPGSEWRRRLIKFTFKFNLVVTAILILNISAKLPIYLDFFPLQTLGFLQLNGWADQNALLTWEVSVWQTNSS